MSASQYLTLFVTAIYIGIAVTHGLNGRVGLGMAFAGYAFANVGLIYAE